MRLCQKDDFERVNATDVWKQNTRWSKNMMLCPDTLEGIALNKSFIPIEAYFAGLNVLIT